ncbi:MAG: hypothetical protein KC646_14305 [Candidatus Cloacimonetes bacterium]|nr:hypothetical protein [Candidatus Cloacimonadota bacterium]
MFIILLLVGCSRDNDHPEFSLGQSIVADFSRFHLNRMVGTIETVNTAKDKLDTSGVFYSYSPDMEFIGKMGPYDVQIRLEEDTNYYIISGTFGPVGSVNGRAYLSTNNGIYMDFYDQDFTHYRGTIK